MVQRISEAQTVALKNLQQQFIDWRKAGRTGKRIPAELWAAATEIARQVGLNRVAKTAGLDYSKLKRLMNSAATQTAKPAAVPDFVQLPMDSLIQTPQCVIEFSGEHGTQTMRLSGYDTATIITLAQRLSGVPG